MKRRDFIKIAGISAALLPVAPSVFGTQAVHTIPLRTHSYRLTYQVHLPEEGKKARLWLPLPDTDDLRSALRHYERLHILRVLDQCPDKREAAKRLKLGLSSLYRKIEELGIDL